MSCARPFTARSAAERGAPNILVQMTSFGYRHGVPADSDLVFDVRFLPNPNYIPAFKKLTGKHPSVARYIRSFPQTQEFIERISELLIYLLPHYIAEGKSYLTISFGCTGGHHRSVMIAHEIRKRLARPDIASRKRIATSKSRRRRGSSAHRSSRAGCAAACVLRTRRRKSSWLRRSPRGTKIPGADRSGGARRFLRRWRDADARRWPPSMP